MEYEATPQLTHRDVVDDHFAKVGTVTDVLYDGEDAVQPRWLVVKTGLVGGERVTPVEGSYVADNGALVLPFDRGTVKRAPKIPHDHVLTRRDEEEVVEYYQMAQ